ncbi:MAG: hypothetical protein EKE20_14405 [Candidatus Symbiopectobacterium sp. Dall1.0]|nr:hypothetical protein [Candidatus Symbiopectobacterium sp. Dall1.0]
MTTVHDGSQNQSVAPHWATGPASPSSKADISRYKRFFCVRNQRCAPIMVGRSGGALALAGFFATGLAALLRLATLPASRERGLKELSKEATAMVATAYTRPEFTDTYWIIHEYSTAPYGKVSFTRQDRRTFIALFKDSRLIWAGRQPVQGMVNITPPSAITNIFTVQGMAHV